MIIIKRNLQIAVWLLLSVLLISCGQVTTPTISTTLIPTSFFTESPLPVTSLPTASSVPHTATPTVYTVLTGTFTPTPSYLPAATKSDEQVYIDPEGWYAVNIPAEWQAEDSPNSFVGEDGFFQTGYLPEMMHMRGALDVCQWLANIDTKGTYSVSCLRTHGSTIGSGCQLNSLPGVTPAAVLEVIQSPSADYPHRFLYIKSDKEHFDHISYTLAWLSPGGETGEEELQTENLRTEDISFWDNTDPLPPGFSITEYKLPAEAQNASPGEKIFLEFIPPEALPKPRKSSSTYTPKSQESVNETITPFGYDLRPGGETYLYDLYKDGALALKNIHRLPDVYMFSTSDGEKLVFLALTVKDPAQAFYAQGNAVSYLVQNDTITLWENKPVNPMYTGGRAIWAADEPLILGLGDHTDVQVRNGYHDLLFSFATYFGTHIPIKRFLAWNDHWILAVSDFVIQDGEILNAKFGFEEVFNWYLMEGKPFYFFRKGPQVGISYDGRFLPVYYHEIIHGYCCGLALNNPRTHENTIRFFGKRDGIWKYVIVEIE